jgi:hypothetical protein
MRIGKRISAGLMTLALGFAVTTANAQPILQTATLKITTAAGTKVGIGKTVTVTADVFQSSADAELQLLVWLISDGAGASVITDVLFDGTVNATVDPLVLGALRSVSAVDPNTNARQLAILQAGALKDVNPALAEAGSFILAREKKNTASTKAATGLPNHAKAQPTGRGNFGDADPAASSVTGSGDIYTFTVAFEIPSSTGDFVDVSVAAIAYDGTDAEYSTDIAISPIAQAVGVDGRRPSQEGISISQDDGAKSAGYSYLKWADGTSNKSAVGAATHRVTGFAAGDATRDVGKTSDLIRVDIDLDQEDATPGPQENAIKSPSSTLKLILDVFGTEVEVDKTQAGAILSHATTITANTFKDLSSAAAATTNFTLYVEDSAGNRSSLNSSGTTGDPLTDDETASGTTAAVKFVIDSTAPVLSGNVQDYATTPVDKKPVRTIVSPASAQAISDGTINDSDYSGVIDASDTRGVPADGSAQDSSSVDPLLSWELREALRTLKIEFKGSLNTVTIANAATAKFAHDQLLAGAVRYLDFTKLSTSATGNTYTNKQVSSLASRIRTSGVDNHTQAGAGDKLVDGTYDIVFTPTDLAGNVGTALTATDVTIDMTELVFKDRFPTTASFGADATRDTINATTANTTFALSEAADSVRIIFDDIGSANKDTFFVLSTAQLADTKEQTILIGPALTDDTDYKITVIGRDTAGNFSLSGPDTLHYNAQFIAPTIAQFVVELVDTASPPAVVKAGAANPFLAGATLMLRIKATDAKGKTAVTFDEDVIITVTATSAAAGCVDCALVAKDANSTAPAKTTGTTWSIKGDDFLVGSQTLKLTNELAPETLTVSATDSAVAFTGSLDSIIVYNPAVYSQIILASDITVDQGEKFRVNVTLADKFGNTRVKDNRFVEVTTNAPDAQLPAGALAIKKGAGWFDAVFATGSTHTITVRDIVATNVAAKTTAYPVNSADVGNDFISGSIDIGVNAGPVAWNLGAPGAVDADDYMGASGAGDQGGFVILTFAASADHATLDEYLIERQIEVNYTSGATTSDLAYVAWGSAAPTPGAATMRVIVATLDGDITPYAVSSVRGGVVAKEAFSVSDKVSSPYELMAQTLQNSRQLAKVDVDAPVFATLAPEALAFVETGIVPRLKTGGSVDRSRKTISNPARAVDNIAPAPVAFLKALDTQSDLGGSISLQWSKSVDDQILTQSVPNAIGGAQVYTVQGVKAYNIYRKAGDGEFALIGQAGSGETSFQDQTVFNGMPYTYQVRPSDSDNIAETTLVSSALAVRNNVRDSQGVLVRGLFGVDNRVDFDDFFVLADRFGQSASDVTFDPAFDLSPNNRIDLDDFFVFVDNFGRSITGSSKAVPMLAGLNSDARIYIDAGSELPRIGEDMSLAINLEDYVELRGYGLTVNYDADVLEFVGSTVENGLLGEGDFAQPTIMAQTDGQVSIGAFGEAASKGDLGLSLVFRSKGEIESSIIEITDAEVRDGGFGINSMPTPVSVQVETRPEVYSLADNYPNPFNPETTLKYQLPESADVMLEIYNMLGQVVRTLVNEQQSAGRYSIQWDARNDNGHSLSSGIYFYRIQAGGEFAGVKKMLLVK